MCPISYSDVLEELKSLAYLESSSSAINVFRSTLETLAERIDHRAAEDLANYLPEELRHHLLDTIRPPETFSLQTFFNRISLREDGSLLSAVFHARCALNVLAALVPEENLSHVRRLLPSELQALFEPNAVWI
ncbi:MAG TPA: DUF2267 domain-containing protein [Opitutaceae bacterium]